MKPKKPARIQTSADVKDSASLSKRASKVAQVAPSSPLYNDSTKPVASALNAFVVEGQQLVMAEDQVLKDEATAAKSRALRDALLLSITGTYHIAVTTVEKYGTSAADLVGCGFDPGQRLRYAVVPPLDLIVGYDKLRELFDILVKHAPGMHAAYVEIASDPIAGPWNRIPGIAAEHHLAGYAPGTWWVRAQSVRGATLSAWLGPVSVIIK